MTRRKKEKVMEKHFHMDIKEYLHCKEAREGDEVKIEKKQEMENLCCRRC